MFYNLIHIDGYTARNLAMFLYPIYGYFVYVHYNWHKLTPWIAGGLLLSILFSGTTHKLIDRPLAISKAIEIYHQKKLQEKGIIYVQEDIEPQPFCPASVNRTMGGGHDVNIVFRLFIWQDMIKEMIEKKAWFGFGLSHPLRSPQLEMLHWAEGEWGRDGWISAHNSYLYVIYRTGIIGLTAIGWLLFALYRALQAFIRLKDGIGLVLIVCLSYWLWEACFQEQWQVPYYAIPFWVLIGLIFNRKELICL